MTNTFISAFNVAEFEQNLANELLKPTSIDQEIDNKYRVVKAKKLIDHLLQASTLLDEIGKIKLSQFLDNLALKKTAKINEDISDIELNNNIKVINSILPKYKLAVKKFEPVKILIYTPSESEPDRLHDIGEDIRHYNSFKEGIEYALKENGIISFEIWEPNKRKRTSFGWAINPKDMPINEIVKTLYDGLEENAWRYEEIGEKWQDHFKI